MKEDHNAYDTIGNRTSDTLNGMSRNYAANCLNQYTQVDAAQMVYDTDGNLVRDDRFVYSYDAENRMISSRPIAPSEGDLAVVNAYDHKHRRVMKRVERFDGDEWQTSETHAFTYDGSNIVLERIAFANGTTRTVEYFWGNDLSGTEQGAGGVGGLVAVSVDGAFFIPCYDHNGNVVCYVSESGAIAAQYVYAPYGNVIEQYGALAGRFAIRFSTKYTDIETGLISYLRRFYCPDHGRWLNRDPIEERGGENLYAFCGNNSLVDFDLQGNISLASLLETISRVRDLANRLKEMLSEMSECIKVVNSWRPGHERDSDTNDKFRHCVGSCEIAKACGDKISIALGLAKEMRDIVFSLPQNIAALVNATQAEMWLDSIFNGDTFADNLADLTADVMGIDIKNANGDCECACRKYYTP